MRSEIFYVQAAEDIKKDVTTSIWEEDRPALRDASLTVRNIRNKHTL